MMSNLPNITQMVRYRGQSVIFSILYCQTLICLLTPTGHHDKGWLDFALWDTSGYDSHIDFRACEGYLIFLWLFLVGYPLYRIDHGIEKK